MDAFAQHGREEVVTHPKRDYVVDFMTGGTYMLLPSWSRDGFATPPAQMAELAYHLMPGLVDTQRTRPPGRTSSARPERCGTGPAAPNSPRQLFSRRVYSCSRYSRMKPIAPCAWCAARTAWPASSSATSLPQRAANEPFPCAASSPAAGRR